MMQTTKEFFRYESVADRFPCEDCGSTHDVVRCTCWLADENDRAVIWHECSQCLRDEFQLDTRDDLSSHLRELLAWLRTEMRQPLVTADDFPLLPDGKTLGEAILEILSGDV